jgi:phenylalanyl-tRNA synthetase alpha chain
VPETDLDRRAEELRGSFRRDISSAGDESALEAVRVRYLSRKSGLVPALVKELGKAPPEERPRLGKLLNEVKDEVEGALRAAQEALRARERERGLAGERIDVTLPGRRPAIGRLHPLALVQREIEAIFTSMGYRVDEGPEAESDYYNFEALAMPPDHPARDMQDTFFLGEGWVLRTHTSPVQIRTMERQAPPVRIIAPGKVYRRDSDPSHSPMFHQVEGLLVDEGVSFAHLRGTLEAMLHGLFGPEVRLRLRPSYFPFTEPSAEMDMSCLLCGGAGCVICKRTGWLELGGCGMVDPEVFRFVGYDPERYTGFAFGFGIDRMAMLKYGIDNIRTLYESDVRFLSSFPL